MARKAIQIHTYAARQKSNMTNRFAKRLLNFDGDRFSIEARGSIALSAFIRFAPPGQMHVVKLFRQGYVL